MAHCVNGCTLAQDKTSHGRNFPSVHMISARAPPRTPSKPMQIIGRALWSVPAFLDTRLGCQLTELPIS